MAELKTKQTTGDVDAFLAAVEPEARRADAIEVCKLMRKITRDQATLWGPSIVGFGNQHYKYESGREGDWFKVGFSPRKAALTLYLGQDFPKRGELLAKLGKHTQGKGCVYIKKLSDVDRTVLEQLIAASVK
jgi:hypothetical protein